VTTLHHESQCAEGRTGTQIGFPRLPTGDMSLTPLPLPLCEWAGTGGRGAAKNLAAVGKRRLKAGTGWVGPIRDIGHVAMLVVLRRLAMSALLTVLGRLGLLTGLVMLTTLAVLAFLAAAVLVVLAV
jgi:hypothetical protein